MCAAVSMGACTVGQANTGKFCGLAAAQACVRDLDAEWGDTTETRILQENSVVSLLQIAEAMHSLDLRTQSLLVDSESIRQLSQVLPVGGNRTRAIAWINLDSETVEGHFVVVAAVDSELAMTGYDPSAGTDFRMRISRNSGIPMLLVRNREAGNFASVAEKIESALSSAYGSLSLVCMLILALLRALSVSWRRSLATSFGIAAMCVVLSQGSWWQYSYSSGGPVNREVRFAEEKYTPPSAPSGGFLEFTALLVNESAHDCIIDEIKGSCNCIKISTDGNRIPALNSLPVRIHVSRVRVGRNHHSIFVKGQGIAAKTELIFDGVRSCRISPRREMVGSISRSEDVELISQLRVVDSAQQLEQIIKVRMLSETPAFFVDLVSKEVSQDGAFQVSLRPSAQLFRTGHCFEKFVVTLGYKDHELELMGELGIDFID
ncbi:hypothetical protein [Rhodopirellula europaea]|uniref:hypothetical protein n=1 Tax=Rhodopirellula europaea TaxID=1263866 RepID=UPI003D280579